jgi:peptide/nickel transport system substrate-binding protein
LQTADAAGFNAYPHTALSVTSANGMAYSQFFKPKLANRALGEEPLAVVVGDILESFEVSPDGLTITGKLRRNAGLDPRPPTNGRMVNIDDVLYSWKKIRDLGKARGSIANAAEQSAPIQDVTAPDSSTIVFKLAFPSASILSNLAFPLNGAFIYPVEAEDKFDPRQDMRGSGQWMLQQYQPSVSFSYRRNPNHYNKERPYLDGVDYPILPEYATQLAQFKLGRVYSMAVRPADQIPTRRDAPGMLMLANQFSNSVRYPIFFSFLPGSPWIDDRLRLGLSMCIDRDLLTETIYNVEGFRREGIPVEVRWNTHVGVGEAEYWLDPKNSKFGDNARYFKVDLAEATKLVRAAVNKAKFDSPLHYPNPPTYGADYQATIPILVNMANEGPFNLKQTGSDYNTVYSRVISGHSRPTGGHDFEGAAVAGVTEFPEVDSWLGAHLLPGGAFYKFEEEYPPSGDRFFALLRAQQRELDRKKRVDIIKEFQQYAAGKMYIVPTLGASTTFTLGWSWVGNFGAFDGRGGGALETWWLDKSKMPA